jgi:hypothetical protein
MSFSQYSNLAGIVVNLIGVVLLFRYGMPYRVSFEPIALTLGSLTSIDLQTERLYRRLGLLGLGLIVFGAALQIVATVTA